MTQEEVKKIESWARFLMSYSEVKKYIKDADEESIDSLARDWTKARTDLLALCAELRRRKE